MIPTKLPTVFARVLAGIASGELGGCPSDTGLDNQTVDALDDYAAAVTAGTDTSTAIANAQTQLRAMLDGTHAKQDRQRRLDQR